MLGPLLLHDSTGAIVDAIVTEHRGNAEQIYSAIFREWLSGRGLQPITWATLTRAMVDAEQVALAEQITKSL